MFFCSDFSISIFCLKNYTKIERRCFVSHTINILLIIIYIMYIIDTIIIYIISNNHHMFPIVSSIFINYQSHISGKRIILILVICKQLRDFYPRQILGKKEQFNIGRIKEIIFGLERVAILCSLRASLTEGEAHNGCCCCFRVGKREWFSITFQNFSRVASSVIAIMPIHLTKV